MPMRLRVLRGLAVCLPLAACSTGFSDAGLSVVSPAQEGPAETIRNAVNIAAKLGVDYLKQSRATDEAQAASNLPLIGLATAAASALVYGAHPDLPIGLGIGAGAFQAGRGIYLKANKAEVLMFGARALNCIATAAGGAFADYDDLRPVKIAVADAHNQKAADKFLMPKGRATYTVMPLPRSDSTFSQPGRRRPGTGGGDGTPPADEHASLREVQAERVVQLRFAARAARDRLATVDPKQLETRTNPEAILLAATDAAEAVATLAENDEALTRDILPEINTKAFEVGMDAARLLRTAQLSFGNLIGDMRAAAGLVADNAEQLAEYERRVRASRLPSDSEDEDKNKMAMVGGESVGALELARTLREEAEQIARDRPKNLAQKRQDLLACRVGVAS